MRRLAFLQWVGLLAGAALWGAGHIAGYGITEARCSRGGSGWGIDLDLWEALTNGLAAALTVGAGLAAVLVIAGTRGESYESEPPVGRIRFFATAALVANVLFLAMLVLYTVGTTANVPCRQA